MSSPSSQNENDPVKQGAGVGTSATDADSAAEEPQPDATAGDATTKSARSLYAPILIVGAIVVLIDQITKIIVVNTMTQGMSIPVLGDWLRFTYTENPGMAFGIELGSPALVTIFSIAATVLIVIYLARVGKLYAPYRYSLALVLGGAFGNIIDRVFYGRILYDEPLFLGRVVDFIHVNLWRGYVPEGVPLLGGKYVALFPIWNVADMAIVTGVVGILVFQRAFHREVIEKEVPSSTGTAVGEGLAGAPSPVDD